MVYDRVYLKKLISRLQPSVLPHRTLRENGPDVMMRSHFLTVLHIHCSLQTDAKTTSFPKLTQLPNLSKPENYLNIFNFEILILVTNFTRNVWQYYKNDVFEWILVWKLKYRFSFLRNTVFHSHNVVWGSPYEVFMQKLCCHFVWSSSNVRAKINA